MGRLRFFAKGEGSRRGGLHLCGALASGSAAWRQEEGGDGELGQSWVKHWVGRRDEKS
jgi:hypothetical protein